MDAQGHVIDALFHADRTSDVFLRPFQIVGSVVPVHVQVHRVVQCTDSVHHIQIVDYFAPLVSHQLKRLNHLIHIRVAFISGLRVVHVVHCLAGRLNQDLMEGLTQVNRVSFSVQAAFHHGRSCPVDPSIAMGNAEDNVFRSKSQDRVV